MVPPAGGVTTPVLSLFSGDMGGSGNSDGIGSVARFSLPQGLGSDSAGNIYVADGKNREIRKISASGVVTTVVANNANFQNPCSVTADSAGNVYVADEGVISKIASNGNVTVLASNTWNYGWTLPWTIGIAADGAGNVYVPDPDKAIVRRISPAGAVTIFAGLSGVKGTADGSGPAATFSHPNAVTTDSSGNVFVADGVLVRKITPNGLVTTVAGANGHTGSVDGPVGQAGFDSLNGIAVDGAGNIYVTDRSYTMRVRKITPAGLVSTVTGSAPLFVMPQPSLLNYLGPTGIVADNAGNIYSADTGYNVVRKMTPDGTVSIFAGAEARSGNLDGASKLASFYWPTGIAADSMGNLFVADTGNNAIRQITAAGTVSTFAGSASSVTCGNGMVSEPAFSAPTGVAVDAQGKVYVADEGHQRVGVISISGTVNALAGPDVAPCRPLPLIGSGVTTVVINPNWPVDGVGTAATFVNPYAITVDTGGNVYVTDSASIRKISPATVVTTFAGYLAGTVFGPGGPATPTLNSPSGVAIDNAGNIYLADSQDHLIYKATPNGMLTKFAGSGHSGSVDGNGANASFNNPTGITVDNLGNVYVADTGNNTIRKITPAGAVTTVAGIAGKIGFQPGPLPGVLPAPRGVLVSGSSLYITAANGIAVVSPLP